jgi:hypothetical protein
MVRWIDQGLNPSFTPGHIPAYYPDGCQGVSNNVELFGSPLIYAPRTFYAYVRCNAYAQR